MMDALSFLKLLWRPTPTPVPIPAANDETPGSFVDTDDDADSFFELDVALSDVDTKSCDSPKVPFNVDYDCIVLKSHESISMPVSPISILRSNPSFRGPMFGESRAAAEKQKAGEGTGDINRAAKKSARLFTARLDDVPQRRNNAGPKDGFMKYMKKPFKVSYVGGASRRYGYGGNEDSGFAASRFSPSSSPGLPPKKGRPESGIQVMGKSKSVISSFSVADVKGRGRRNDIMAEQQEGINGAILHCKKSYYTPPQ